jgi:hypothetical protein
MTAPAPRRNSRSLIVAIAAVCIVAFAACSANYFEIPIETPVKPKLDVSAFQRVLVAGFVSGGTEDLDANQETVRLLRSQLRTKSSLRVIDADAMPLVEIAQNQNRTAAGVANPGGSSTPDAAPARAANPGGPQAPSANVAPTALPTPIKDEKDIEPYERLFANTTYWKQIGEEYQNPLIVTGTVLFMEQTATNITTRQNERLDAFGRRQVDQERVFTDKKGFVLQEKFIFIDGRTGAQIDQEFYKEQISYNAQQNMPPLSSYFELMDQIVPRFLNLLSSQKIRGTRVLLR